MTKQICSRCVMDNVGDETIEFKEDGTCNYCNYALERMPNTYFPNEEGRKKLSELINKIKDECRNQQYDCLMGISGGLDSAYLAYIGSKYNLRILAIHIDDGFDTDIAKSNIYNLCKNCNINLITIKPNEEQYNDLIRAFILAGVPNIAMPQDNVLFSKIYEIARKNKIKYFLSGANFSMESILQRGNVGNSSDKVHILDIHRKFGRKKINDLKLMSLFEKYIKNKYFYKINTIRPLDWIDYNRERAIKELEDVGFYYYGGKHYESIFTKFMQVYYMPKKFNVDIRKSHLSSLIISNQMTRDEALMELAKPLYEETEMQKDIDYILDKLDITKQEFDEIMKQPPKKHSDYKMSKLNNFANIARKYRKFLSD